MKQVDILSVAELEIMSQSMYGNIVKAVVDIKNSTLVVDAPMHVDLEQYLLEHGSQQSDLWGINFHPAKFGSNDFVEFDSMINIRPRANNLSRSIEDPKIQQVIREIVTKIVHE